MSSLTSQSLLCTYAAANAKETLLVSFVFIDMCGDLHTRVEGFNIGTHVWFGTHCIVAMREFLYCV